MKCPKCDGKGYSETAEYYSVCKFCGAKKDLNWLEMIFGIDEDDGGVIRWRSNNNQTEVYRED